MPVRERTIGEMSFRERTIRRNVRERTVRRKKIERRDDQEKGQ
jgi:hypothetical protein